MRPSLKNTPLAVLRGISGMTADFFADMIGVKTNYLRRLECGRHDVLSVQLAERISAETGCDPRWLLAGKPSAPCRATLLKKGKLTQAGFEAWRAFKLAGIEHNQIGVNLSSFLPELAGIAEASSQNGRLVGFQLRLEKYVQALKNEFGVDAKTNAEVRKATLPTVFVTQGEISEFKELRVSFSGADRAAVYGDGEFIKEVRRFEPVPIKKEKPVRKRDQRKTSRRASGNRKVILATSSQMRVR